MANSARLGGAILNYYSTASFVNSTVSFVSNTADSSGGAIYNGGSTVSFINSIVSFVSNSAWIGMAGAIYNNNSLLVFDNSSATFLNNSANANYYDGSGGAIYNSGSSVSFVNSTISFLDNRAQSGGAIFNQGSTISFTNATVSFFDNTAENYGGAIYNRGSSVSFVNSTVSFVSNTADSSGGAIFNQGSTISFTNATVNFSHNNAYGYRRGSGGAIYNSSSAVSFVNSTVSFVSNTAAGYYGSGGAIYNWGSTVSFVNSTVDFSSNSASQNGGAIYNNSSTVSFVNSTVDFSYNSADYWAGGSGGAIYNENSTTSFTNSAVSFLANTATGNGGAIYNLDSTVSFVNSTVSFLSNTATGNGGAIYANTSYYGGTVISFVNSSITFISNTAEDGGAIYLSDAELNIEGFATFLSNTANYGGAIYAGYSAELNIEGFATFSNNTANSSYYNGYYYNGDGGAIDLSNSELNIKGTARFSNNTATGNGGAIYAGDSTLSLIASGKGIEFSGNYMNWDGSQGSLNDIYITRNSVLNLEAAQASSINILGGLRAYNNSTVNMEGNGDFHLGGINIFDGSKLNITNGNLYVEKATFTFTNGGPIYNDGGHIVFDMAFSSNVLFRGNANAIYNNNGLIEIIGDNKTAYFSIEGIGGAADRAIEGDGTIRKYSSAWLNLSANASNFTGTFEQYAGTTTVNLMPGLGLGVMFGGEVKIETSVLKVQNYSGVLDYNAAIGNGGILENYGARGFFTLINSTAKSISFSDTGGRIVFDKDPTNTDSGYRHSYGLNAKIDNGKVNNVVFRNAELTIMDNGQTPRDFTGSTKYTFENSGIVLTSANRTLNFSSVEVASSVLVLHIDMQDDNYGNVNFYYDKISAANYNQSGSYGLGLSTVNFFTFSPDAKDPAHYDKKTFTLPVIVGGQLVFDNSMPLPPPAMFPFNDGIWGFRITIAINANLKDITLYFEALELPTLRGLNSRTIGSRTYTIINKYEVTENIGWTAPGGSASDPDSGFLVTGGDTLSPSDHRIDAAGKYALFNLSTGTSTTTFLSASTYLHLKNLTIINAYARPTYSNSDGTGSALKMSHPKARAFLETVVITSNTAETNGGAVAINVPDGASNVQTTLISNNSIFSSNTATGGSGGAIFAHKAANIEIISTQFNFNRAEVGGAISISNSSLIISGNSNFSNNTSTLNGGAIYVDSDAELHLDGNITFINDTTAGQGGAIFNSGVVTFHQNADVTFDQNYASQGNDIYNEGILNIDIDNNHNIIFNGGIYATAESVINKTGEGSIILSGNNTLHGTVNIEGGKVELNSSADIDNVNLAEGATLVFASNSAGSRLRVGSGDLRGILVVNVDISNSISDQIITTGDLYIDGLYLGIDILDGGGNSSSETEVVLIDTDGGKIMGRLANNYGSFSQPGRLWTWEALYLDDYGTEVMGDIKQVKINFYSEIQPINSINLDFTHNQSQANEMLFFLVNQGNAPQEILFLNQIQKEMLERGDLQGMKRFMEELSGEFLANVLTMPAIDVNSDSIFDKVGAYDVKNDFWTNISIGSYEIDDEAESLLGALSMSAQKFEIGKDLLLIKDRRVKGGIYAALINKSIGQDGNRNTAEIVSFEGGVYANWEIAKGILGSKWKLGISFDDIETMRYIQYSQGNKRGRVNGSATGETIKFGTVIDYPPQKLGTGVSAGVYAQVDAAITMNGELNEIGNGAALNVKSDNYTRVATSIGGKILIKPNKKTDINAKVFVGFLPVGAEAQYDISFAASPSNYMEIEKAKSASTFAGGGVALSYQLTKSINVGASFSTNIGLDTSETSTAVGIGATMKFGGTTGNEKTGNERERKRTTGNDNGELPPAKQKAGEQQTATANERELPQPRQQQQQLQPAEQNGGQAATANDRDQGLGVERQGNERELPQPQQQQLPPAKQKAGERQTATIPLAGGQEQGTYVATFDTNSSDLSQNARLVISNVVQNVLRKQYTTIMVMGFAAEGINEEANIALSIQRAQAVAIELMKYGIDRTKVRIEFFGSQNPRFPANTPEGRARNQRVEIVVVE